MTINYWFKDVGAHGAPIRAQAASFAAERQAIARDVLAARHSWDGAGSVVCQQFITPGGQQLRGGLWTGRRSQPGRAGGRQRHGTDRQRGRLQLARVPLPRRGVRVSSMAETFEAWHRIKFSPAGLRFSCRAPGRPTTTRLSN
jgi:hypothetical protein